MKDLYIIVPAYNEDNEVLKITLSGLLGIFKNIVVVNDGGDPQLISVLRGLQVHYLRHDINLGQGAALQTGMEYALELGAEEIAFFDADGQHNPKDLVEMEKVLDRGQLDIVLGSRFLKKEHRKHIPLIRKLILKSGTYINFLFTGLLLSDAHHGLKILSKKAAGLIKFKENRQLHATELLWIIKKYKLHYKEMPAAVTYSAYSLEKGQKNMAVFKIFSDLVLSKFIK